jgi:hypothetical protein
VLDVAVRAAEVAVEDEGDRLVDDQTAVGGELDDDCRVPERERLRIDTRGNRKRSRRERRG